MTPSVGNLFVQKYQTGPTRTFDEKWVIASTILILAWMNRRCGEAFTVRKTERRIYRGGMFFYRRISITLAINQWRYLTNFLALVHPTQGHKSRANDPYVGEFFKWIKHAGWKKNGVLGEPQLKEKILSMTEEECRSSCSKRDKEEDACDGIC